MKRDLLTIRDLTAEEIHRLVGRAREMKQELRSERLRPTLSGKILGLIFVKPSTRTRVSFETAMYRLGGQCVFMTANDLQISRHEPMPDTARVLSRYLDAVVIRTFAHQDVEELARHASIPIINGLTDSFHPCQVLSDLVTIQEKRGTLEDLCVAWIGDGNNMAHSWINAAARLSFTLYLACPPGYLPQSEIVDWARREGRGTIHLVDEPKSAVASADVLYTDVWASMGQEAEAEARRKVFQPFQINEELLAAAPANALVLHCLPAHRGEEITDGVMEGPQSVVFDQAENRMFLQMALLEWLLQR
ncbi:MAG TPA: ornithine carbamoyltransferase [Syntrophobacteraceae bacterium]|nr:ornithine carbamoyltransferase [Syntrophobacteraceae bacterium]